MRRLGYLVREAIANIRINRTTTLIAVATTAFTLACFGVFLLLYVNLHGIVSGLQDDIKVIVYLHDNLSPQGTADLQRRFKSEPEVASLTYVSKDQALADFRVQFPSEQHLLQGLGENPLPASFVVTLGPRFRSSESVKRWAERMKAVPGVVQIEYSRDWIDNLATVVGYLELAAIAVGSLLSAASVTIIANTIRLTLYARREEIEVMRLIGATGAFIKIPYLLEGAALGALGATLALILLKAGFEFFKLHLGAPGRFLGIESGFTFFPTQVWLLMILAGFLLGCLGSFVSVLGFGRARA
ncbi:MAG TPA: permease-like cell division protein FtsX [Nitrospiraceae bacterium]|jgi:cell division transport system permease protein|nr:permease-like cell division protein FtsX [Nitrospiraceae bacterium]